MKPIKREKWGNKYWIVLRDENGKRIQWKKYTAKFNTIKAKQVFKQNKTLDENIERVKLARVDEISDFRKTGKRKIPSDQFTYQYVIIVNFKDRDIIARSEKFNKNVPQNIAREDAKQNLFRLLSFDKTGGSNPRTGQKIFDDLSEVQIKEGVVYYRKKISVKTL